MNNSVDPAFQSATTERTVGLWPLLTTTTQQTDGYTVEVSSEKADWSALQFSLSFDTNVDAFAGITSLSPDISTDNFNMLNAGKGIISFAAERPVSGPSDEKRLFSLVFKRKNKAQSSLVLRLTDTPTPAAAYQQDGQRFQPVLVQSEPGSMDVTCSPNPFGTAGTYLNIESKTVENTCLLEVFDAAGQRIFEQKTRIQPGLNSLYIPGLPFQSTGIYLYRLRDLESNMILHNGKFIFGI